MDESQEFKEAKKKWEIDRRIKQEQINRGSQYPPFSIEPMPHERQRLSNPMTAEERAARKQWVMDQKLAPNEPRNVNWVAPEQYPHDVKCRNAIRRFYRAPMDNLARLMTPLFGQSFAVHMRQFLPALGGLYASGLIICYYMKYNTNTWENLYGIGIYKSKDPVYDLAGSEIKFPESSDFNDRGFKNRKCLFDNKTSRNSEMSSVKYPYES